MNDVQDLPDTVTEQTSVRVDQLKVGDTGFILNTSATDVLVTYFARIGGLITPMEPVYPEAAPGRESTIECLAADAIPKFKVVMQGTYPDRNGRVLTAFISGKRPIVRS
jgi:hypothetical protein